MPRVELPARRAVTLAVALLALAVALITTAGCSGVANMMEVRRTPISTFQGGTNRAAVAEAEERGFLQAVFQEPVVAMRGEHLKVEVIGLTYDAPNRLHRDRPDFYARKAVDHPGIESGGAFGLILAASNLHESDRVAAHLAGPVYMPAIGEPIDRGYMDIEDPIVLQPGERAYVTLLYFPSIETDAVLKQRWVRYYQPGDVLRLEGTAGDGAMPGGESLSLPPLEVMVRWLR